MRLLHYRDRAATGNGAKPWATSLAAVTLWVTAMSSQAAIVSYSLSPNSDYLRERSNVANGLPIVFDTRTQVTGQVKVDTSTGELLSASLALANYGESYDFDPLFNPGSDYAELSYSGETQAIAGGLAGQINGTSITFDGGNAWFGASVAGSASCSAAAGSNGTNICSNAALTPWGPFDLTLKFSDDYSFFTASTQWSDGDSVTNNLHQLKLIGMSEVPLPAAAWLMLSALLGLFARARKSLPILTSK